MTAFSIESLLSSTNSHFFRHHLNDEFSDEDVDDSDDEDKVHPAKGMQLSNEESKRVERGGMSPCPPRSSSTPVANTAVVRPTSPSPNMIGADFMTSPFLQTENNSSDTVKAASADTSLPQPSSPTATATATTTTASSQLLRPFSSPIVRPIPSKAAATTSPPPPPPPPQQPVSQPRLPTMPPLSGLTLPAHITQSLAFPGFLSPKMFANNSPSSPM